MPDINRAASGEPEASSKTSTPHWDSEGPGALVSVKFSDTKAAVALPF
jgi:hypothetical protein